MIFVRRNANLQIIAIQRPESGDTLLQSEGWETCSQDDPEVRAFVTTIAPSVSATDALVNPLQESDLALARVLEDLIDLLVDRSMIRFTDFPPAAQAKLMERHNARHALRELKLLSEDSQIDDETL